MHYLWKKKGGRELKAPIILSYPSETEVLTVLDSREEIRQREGLASLQAPFLTPESG